MLTKFQNLLAIPIAMAALSGCLDGQIKFSGESLPCADNKYIERNDKCDKAGLAAEPQLAKSEPQTVQINNTTISITVVNQGAAAIACEVRPELPAGMTVRVDNGNCLIEGSPKALHPSTEYTVTATAAGGSQSSTTVTFAIEKSTTAPVLISPSTTFSTVATQAAEPLLLDNLGLEIVSCTASPSLPAGLTVAVHNGSCRISGTPTTETATANYQVTGTAAGGATSTVQVSIGTSAVPVAAAPIASPAAGTYIAAQSVTLSSTTAGATIYYTIDGSPPTTSSLVYSSPISVPSTTTIRAIATKSGFSNSSVSEAAYIIPSYRFSFTKAFNSGTNTSLTATNPGGQVIESGDTLVVVAMTRSAITNISPGSWTTLGTSPGVFRGTYTQIVTVAYKTATGVPATDDSVTVDQTTNARMAVSVLVFKGNVTPSDLQVGAVASTCANAAMPSLTSVSPTEMVVYGHHSVFTPTFGGPDVVVNAQFFNASDLEPSGMTNDAQALYNRLNIGIGAHATDHAVTYAKANPCYVDDATAAEAFRFKIGS